MGNEASNPIRNMDKRTARREYREPFTRAIEDFQRENGVLSDAGGNHGQSKDVLRFDENGKNITVVVRKRPIFPHEVDGSEFDVVSCLKGRTAVIHDTRMHADMRRMLITNNAFAFDGVFNERASNEMVYQSACKPQVREAVRGGYATVCVYGQTGSGKSFTMTSFYEKAAHEIFKELDSSNDRMYEIPRVSMSFFELQGESCLDLLNTFTPTQLLTATDGGVHAMPVVEPTVTSAEEMVALIRHALSIRSTSATGVHDASSRSHAILRIYIEQPPAVLSEGEMMLRRDMNPFAGPPQPGEGVLTLVDLAGSEQSIDSMYHTAELRKEGAAINSSLMALKDCVRAKANGVTATHVYRKSKLTMALKDSFVLPTSRTVIVATVSPSSKDTEHSLNTLRHACLMDGQSQSGDETRFMTGGVQSETYQVGEVDVTAISRKNREIRKAGGDVDVKTSNGNYLGKDVKQKGPMKKPVPELTEKQKAKARRMADRAGLSRMSPELRSLLLGHREQLGREEQQLRRMRRGQSPYLRDGSSRDGVSDSPPPAPPGLPAHLAHMADLKEQVELDKQIYNQVAAASGGGQGQVIGRAGMDEYVKVASKMPFLQQSDEVNNTDDPSASSVSPRTRRPLSARVTAPTKSSHMRVAITSELRSSRELQRKEQEEAAIANDDDNNDDEVLDYVVQKFSPRVSFDKDNATNPEYNDDGEASLEKEIQELEQNIQRAPPRQVQQPQPSDDRTPYYKLYVQVFGRTVEHHDQEAKAVLHRQLQTLMRMHGYDKDEITHLLASGRPTIPKRSTTQNFAPAASSATAASVPTNAQRASHMSSYGGSAAANGARNENVHSTLQTNETKKANVTRQTPFERGSGQQRVINAKAGLASAAQKLEEETRIKEERRSRALAIKEAKDEETREAARQKNKSDVETMRKAQLKAAADEVESKAAVAAQRRENALRVVAQRDIDHKQQALRRLAEKGLSSPQASAAGSYEEQYEAAPASPARSSASAYNEETEYHQRQYQQQQQQPAEEQSSPRARYISPPVPGRRRVIDTAAEDKEIAKVTRLVVQARYQPIETQNRLKKQLQMLKINKTRKEKGEAPLPVTPENHGTVKNSPRPSSAGTRPGSVGAQRPSSAGMSRSNNYVRSPYASRGGGVTRQSSSREALRQSGSNDNMYTGGGVGREGGGMRESSGQMPKQLRHDVHTGSMNMVNSPPNPKAYSEQYQAPLPRRIDTAQLQLHQKQQASLAYTQAQSVHNQGRPIDQRSGGYRVGASAAPFGNCFNDEGEGEPE